jgi:hypothetical protein
MDGIMTATTVIALTSTIAAALGTVALVLWLVDRSNKKFRHRMIDREYERLCQDPRYKVK